MARNTVALIRPSRLSDISTDRSMVINFSLKLRYRSNSCASSDSSSSGGLSSRRRTFAS